MANAHAVGGNLRDRDVQERPSRARTYRGLDLGAADFAGADLRGVDFRQANLRGANLRGVTCGLHPLFRWTFALCALFAAVVLGLVLGSLGGLLGMSLTLPPAEASLVVRRYLMIVPALAVGIVLLALLRRGVGTVLSVFAAIIGLVVLGALLLPVQFTVVNMFILAGVGAQLAVTVLLAALFLAASRAYRRQFMVLLLTFCAIAIVPAIWESSIDFGDPDPLPGAVKAMRLVVASAAVLVHLATSVYIARIAPSAPARYGVISRAVINLLTRWGTRFGQADLTEACFAQADMRHADLAGATLLHTDWLGARNLDQAKIADGYLASPALRALAATRTGADQCYTGLSLEGICLDDADLRRADFLEANLSRTRLRRADLSQALLVNARLCGADLRGACLTGTTIQGWVVSTDTQLNEVICEHVYLRLPTADDPDPMRKPDNKADKFQPGDFSDFIAPILRTLDLYERQYVDPRTVGRAYRTLDLVHHDDVDARASALALVQLAQAYPDAGLILTALETRGRDKLRMQATVAAAADRSHLSQMYETFYAANVCRAEAEIADLLAHGESDSEEVRRLADLMHAMGAGDLTYMTTRILLGKTVLCLIFAANPLDTDYLRHDVELRDINEALAATDSARYFVVEYLPAARPDDLLKTLSRRRPAIVQFSGHGTHCGEIMMMDDQGYAKPVSTEALTALFTALKKDIRLVILNACYAETQARSISQVIDCTIGVSDIITDEAAIRFVVAFYRALGHGCSVQEAYDQGLVSLMLEGVPAEQKPILLHREGVDPGSIYFI